jgi:hypothetical protein
MASAPPLPDDLRDCEHEFLLSGNSGLAHEPLVELLGTFGLRQGNFGATKHPAVMWVEPVNERYARECFGVPCGMKNMLDEGKNVIRFKSELFFNMQKQFPEETKKYMADTFVCEKYDWITKDDVFIVKPVSGYGGKGITVVRGPDGILAARESARAQFRKSDVIMSRYITDPLLWQGRKFHIRMYLLAVVLRGQARTHLWPEGKMFTGGKPYVNDHFGDDSIHDTHAKSTDGDLFFPADLARGGIAESERLQQHIWEQMQEVMTCVSRVLLPHARGYCESLHACEVFGLDFLVRSDGRIVLMEVNDKVGYAFNSPATSAVPFSTKFFNWIRECVFAPLLASTPPPEPLFSCPAATTPVVAAGSGERPGPTAPRAAPHHQHRRQGSHWEGSRSSGDYRDKRQQEHAAKDRADGEKRMRREETSDNSRRDDRRGRSRSRSRSPEHHSRRSPDRRSGTDRFRDDRHQRR